MRDSRIPLAIPETTLSSSTTSVTGDAIDLLDGYTFNNSVATGTSLFGNAFTCMGKSVTLGNDADGFTLTWKIQTAPDASGVPGTWVDQGTIGTMAYDETNGWTRDGTLAGTALGLSRAKLNGRLRTANRWARLVCTSGDLEGTGTVVVSAWVSDNSDPMVDGGRIH